MVLILVAIIAVAVVAFAMVKLSERGCSGWHDLLIISGVLSAVGAAATLIVYSFTVWSWIASEHKTNIINREYGTSYTREEVFYASDVIETVRQLDRKRLEVNGDLLRDKATKP